uniref:Uncharacterized protein n=1 Tax=Anguilla anguilla TaxID=7936 RepID=A0A0E9WC96_ANGAN
MLHVTCTFTFNLRLSIHCCLMWFSTYFAVDFALLSFVTHCDWTGSGNAKILCH